jgi:PAS domain S-box-containing protein
MSRTVDDSSCCIGTLCGQYASYREWRAVPNDPCAHIPSHLYSRKATLLRRDKSQPILRRSRGPGWPAQTLVLLLASCFLLQVSSHAQVREVRRVLFLTDLGTPASPGFTEVEQAVFTALQKSPYQIEFYHESMEVTLFPGEVSQRGLREEVTRKYSDRKPDMIIAAGSASLTFIAESHEKFLQDAPIIFCAILGEIPDRRNPEMHFTGVLGKLHPEETLNAALHLLPGTKHVVVTGGMGKFDARWEAIARQSLHDYESKLEFTYLTDLSMPALLERLRRLPSNTIVYHTAISQDAAGNRFIDAAQSVPLVTGAASAPVFVMDDVDFRAGAVGGDLVNWADDGRVAGEMAVRVLNRERPQDIPIATSNHTYMFDWRALKRWGLNEKNLPAGSVVFNRQPAFWELYWRYVITGVSILLAQALIILALVWQRARRRKAETELGDSQSRLEGIVESAMDAVIAIDERQRIVVFNNAAEKMFGCPMGDAIGSSIDRFIPEPFHEAHRENVRHIGDASPTTRRRTGASSALWGLRANGKEFPVESAISHTRAGGKKLFTVIVRDITEREQAEEALSTVSRRLIEAHEEERKWIARELHDDISQRMAMLAVSLGTLSQDPPASKREVSRRVGEVNEQLGNIASDIQALSHRLHSSKLEYLGLVSAARGFCRELSDQQNVEIAFQSQAIPKNLPQEISLSIFRVLQEALQNAVKYSGVRRFEVSLTGALNEIELTVRDSGVGFDPEKALDGHGLGLTSMKERLKIVDGHLAIDSKPLSGTTIHARVPLSPIARSAAG